mmetsp:Transcript_21681/g.64832  ORF Transcript_21681/g.64832 Transcript_21681/m.64832 type:complete len:205 (+) Transcript_21681:83-697(+)
MKKDESKINLAAALARSLLLMGGVGRSLAAHCRAHCRAMLGMGMARERLCGGRRLARNWRTAKAGSSTATAARASSGSAVGGAAPSEYEARRYAFGTAVPLPAGGARSCTYTGPPTPSRRSGGWQRREEKTRAMRDWLPHSPRHTSKASVVPSDGLHVLRLSGRWPTGESVSQTASDCGQPSPVKLQPSPSGAMPSSSSSSRGG